MPFVHIGKYVFESYTLFINLGTFFSILLCYELLSKYCSKEKYRIKILCFMLITLFAGNITGKLIKNSFEESFSDSTHFMGRVILCAIVLPIFMKYFWKNESLKTYGYNICVVFIVVQHFFNRIACLFNGCCGGKSVGNIILPTQLFEAVAMIVLLIFILLKNNKNEESYCISLVVFGITIFISESMMDYSNVTKIGGLTAVQYSAIILSVIMVIYILFSKQNISFGMNKFKNNSKN